MADLKISQLPAIVSIDDADLFAIVDSSVAVTKKITVADLVTALASEFGVALPDTQIAFGTGVTLDGDPDFTYDDATGDFTTGNGANSFAALGNGKINRNGSLYSIQAGFTSTSWGNSAGTAAAGTNNGGVYIGYAAGISSSNANVVVISGDANNPSSVNYGAGTIIVGNGALISATGQYNVGYGVSAGSRVTTGGSGIYIGAYADRDDSSDTLSNKTGDYNIVMGSIIVGGTAGTAFTGGNAFDSVFAVHGIGEDSNQIIFGGGYTDVFYESLRVGYDSSGNTRGFYFGDVDPENAVTANEGSIYLSNESGTGKVYKKQTGTGDTGWVELGAGGGGGGTVTSFSAGDLAPLFTTSEATATTTPALTFTLNTQNANKVFAGPTNGADAAPTFRVLVAADIPSLSGTYLTIDGATTGATTQRQIFTNGIGVPNIDDDGAGSIELSFSAATQFTFSTSAFQIAPTGSAAAPSFAVGPANGGFYETGGTHLGASVGGALVGGFDATGVFAGLAGTLTGTMKFSGVTSGTVTVQSAAAAGTWTLTLPTTDGNADEFLRTDGNGVTSWVAAQPLDSDLTAIAAITPSNDDIIQRKAGAWTNRTMAQLIADLGALGTTFQPLDADLTSWAGVTRASGFDTFVATPTSANFAALITNEISGGASVVLQTVTAEQSIASTIAFTGGTPPATPVSLVHEWVQTGKLFSGSMRLEYTTAGVTNGSVVIDFPGDWPTPATKSSWNNSEIGISISANIVASAVTNDPVTGVRSAIRKSAGGVYQVHISSGSQSYILITAEVVFTIA